MASSGQCNIPSPLLQGAATTPGPTPTQTVSTEPPIVGKLIICSLVRCVVRTRPEEFKNKVFTLKTHQMVFVHTTLKEFENAPVILGLWLRKTRAGKYRNVVVYEKLRY